MVRMPIENRKTVDRSVVERLISRGAPVKADSIKEDEEEDFRKINLRIPKGMLEEIDSLVKDSIGLTRTSWLLQLIDKELKTRKNLC